MVFIIDVIYAYYDNEDDYEEFHLEERHIYCRKDDAEKMAKYLKDRYEDDMARGFGDSGFIISSYEARKEDIEWD